MITEQEIREAFPIIKQADAARLADVANANGIDLETLKSAIESAAVRAVPRAVAGRTIRGRWRRLSPSNLRIQAITPATAGAKG